MKNKHTPNQSFGEPVAEIRLGGRWLEELEFKEGVQAQIEQQRIKLTITLHKESEA